MSSNLLQNDENRFFNQLLEEFHKSKEDLLEFIGIMKKWSYEQPHFPEKPSDDLLRFVILYNKFNIEIAKEKLDMFYTIRSRMPEFFKTHPSNEHWTLQRKKIYLVPLPKVANEFTRIIYHKVNPAYVDLKYYNFEINLILIFHLLQYMAENDLCYRFHYICDFSGFTLRHAAKINPMSLKKSQIVLEKVFSNRMASLYLVNVPSVHESFCNNVLKPLLNPKIQERLNISATTDILFTIFGKARLPKDIGGEEKSLSELSDMLTQEYENHKERFFELENLTVDENLRPAKLQNDDLLGYYGSFRKLDVD